MYLAVATVLLHTSSAVYVVAIYADIMYSATANVGTQKSLYLSLILTYFRDDKVAVVEIMSSRTRIICRR